MTKPTEPKGTRAAGHDPLLRARWRYVEKTTLDEFTAEDWSVLNAQRSRYLDEELPRQVLRMLESSRDDPTFGYAINNFHHCLQTATLMYRDGCDEESVVVLGLLHDVGFVVCPEAHAEFAACLLGPYASERDTWVLRHHGIFQQHHIHGFPGLDPRAREAYRGHPHFEAAARFVERYDIVALDPDLATIPLEFFEPMVHRFFRAGLARGPRAPTP